MTRGSVGGDRVPGQQIRGAATSKGMKDYFPVLVGDKNILDVFFRIHQLPARFFDVITIFQQNRYRNPIGEITGNRDSLAA